MIITLPWPDKRLSPNARLHWRKRVGPRQDARRRSGWAAVHTKGFCDTKDVLRATDSKIPMRITFYPPDARRRDDDNMIASFKAHRDGIADAFGIDDRRFSPTYVIAEPAKPGRVEVEFFSLPHPVHNQTFAGIHADQYKDGPVNDGCNIAPGHTLNADKER